MDDATERSLAATGGSKEPARQSGDPLPPIGPNTFACRRKRTPSTGDEFLGFRVTSLAPIPEPSSYGGDHGNHGFSPPPPSSAASVAGSQPPLLHPCSAYCWASCTLSLTRSSNR